MSNVHIAEPARPSAFGIGRAPRSRNEARRKRTRTVGTERRCAAGRNDIHGDMAGVQEQLRRVRDQQVVRDSIIALSSGIKCWGGDRGEMFSAVSIESFASRLIAHCPL